MVVMPDVSFTFYTDTHTMKAQHMVESNSNTYKHKNTVSPFITCETQPTYYFTRREREIGARLVEAWRHPRQTRALVPMHGLHVLHHYHRGSVNIHTIHHINIR